MRPGLRAAIVVRMAENTDWFEQVRPEEAREERIIFGVWAARLGILITLLCIVAYATMS